VRKLNAVVAPYSDPAIMIAKRRTPPLLLGDNNKSNHNQL